MLFSLLTSCAPQSLPLPPPAPTISGLAWPALPCLPIFFSLPYLSPHALPCSCPALGLPQFLESYKSVTLASMAATFGLSADFLDAELVSWRALSWRRAGAEPAGWLWRGAGAVALAGQLC